MKKKAISVFLTFLLITISHYSYSWGFFAHKKINRHAVFALPPEMFGFFKRHIEFMTEHAIDPDKRSFAVEGEAVRHYIDIDHFGKNPFEVMPVYWNEAVEKFSEDTLMTYGINPWNINNWMDRLSKAFQNEDFDGILYYAANIGHYIADATVPLHTTKYYDGKIPEQKGIHGFWETRVPILLAKDYDFFVGQAEYIQNVQQKAWDLVKESHFAVDTIFEVETYLRSHFPEDKKFVYEPYGRTTKKEFSLEYTLAFNARTNDMVERKMRRAIHAVASFWYTAWVNAGQPNLEQLDQNQLSDRMKERIEELEKSFEQNNKIKGRPNPDNNYLE